MGLLSDETFVRYRRSKCVVFKWILLVRGLRERISLPRLGYYPVMTVFELVINVWFPRKAGISCSIDRTEIQFAGVLCPICRICCKQQDVRVCLYVPSAYISK